MSNKTIYIKKVKLKDGTLEIEYKEQIAPPRTEDNPKPAPIWNEVSVKSGHRAHADLTNLMKQLRPHLVAICELAPSSHESPLGKYIHMEEDTEPEVLSAYEVSGYTHGGEDEHAGVVLIGRRNLDNNKVLNLVTPFTKFEDEHTPYRYATQLEDLISWLDDEVIAYLNGKHAPDAQTAIDFGDEEEKETLQQRVDRLAEEKQKKSRDYIVTSPGPLE